MVKRPNFDDERTVLNARPVVPLEDIDTKVKHRRRWILGGAFAIAMLLGAASALISAYLRFRSVPDPEIELSTVSSVSEQSVLPVEERNAQQPAIIPKRPRPRPRDTDRTNHIVVRPQLSEDEELRQIRAAVLVDQWQERRQRRVERHERRRTQHHERDLSNLDEIFEGRPRP